MIETRDIALHTYTCDVPGCVATARTALEPGLSGGAANWVTVTLAENDGIVLCPDHAEYRPIIRTVLLTLERKAELSA